MDQYLTEHKLYWPVNSELMASYRDGSHTEKLENGTLVWVKNGKLHRDDDKPARIDADGTLEWYKNGKLHRDGDRPAWIYANGSLAWWKNDVLHRDGDRPAGIIPNDTCEWWKNGKKHRVCGPAAIYQMFVKQYWINGVNITEEVRSWLITRQCQFPLNPEQQVEFSLTFS